VKKSKAETAETRKRIVETAVREFRQKGFQGAGVADIMKAAGLTHGAFYRHFDSKDQLIAEACAASMDTLVDNASGAAEGENAFLSDIESFISSENRDGCLGGCPLVLVGSELARSDPETRQAATRGFRSLMDVMVKKNLCRSTDRADGDAVFALSAMIGAVTMSRIVDDPELSTLILEEAKRRLAAPGSHASARR
jgi:TetR/AcrR family transcriptional repressor of nem operon